MRRTPWILVLAVPVSLSFAACGAGGGASPSQPSSTLIQVGGQYQVSVALGANTCGAVTVQSQPTSVSHTAGATRFSLTHGANTFSGSLGADGSFTTDAATLADPDGSRLVVVLQGRFSATGLTATVAVDLQARPAGAGDCRYEVRWTGTKVGAPNVLP